MRLIDVDELKADYRMADDCKDCKTGYRSCEYDRIYSKMDFCGWLDDAPTVDAVPMVHGHWIDIDTETYTWKIRCSRCGHERNMLSTGKTYPMYCENCGARMDGKGNDNETD